MVDYDTKTPRRDAEDPWPQSQRPPRRESLRMIRSLWDFTVIMLLVGLFYRWVLGQFHQGNEMKMRTATCQRLSTSAELEFDWYALAPSEDIIWASCFDGQKCARLSLPLDYLTPEGPKTEIALRMIPATDTENYKGTILINPGGPGGSGTSLVERAGANISKIVGPEYDILGFDPRGTGATTPQAQCFDSEAQYQIFGLQEGPLLNLTGDSIPLARARQKLVGERCLQAIGGNGKEDLNGTAKEWGPGRFMGTPSVATDMLRITEKLGQQKLQYWGFSYGTILGQYFAALYPDRVGRLIIDGVYDAHNYRGTLWNSNLRDTDAVWSSFYTFCHQAGPSKCPLYAPTISGVEDRVHSILNTLSQSPLPVPFAPKGPGVLTKEKLHQLMFAATYKPNNVFKTVADALLAVESNNQTALADMISQYPLSYQCSCQETTPWLADTEAFYAIACGDGDPISDSPGDYDAYFEALTAQSPFAAPIWGIHYLQCAEWRVTAKWRYMGPLAAQNTSHPLLLISPTFDPVCPLRDAKAVHKRYGGSGLLVQNSYGHCSISAPSLCTAKHIRAYFINGTLPAEGTVCEADELPFIGEVAGEANILSDEDRELLEALRGLSTAVPMFGNIGHAL